MTEVEEADKLSCLPDDLIDRILSLLSIKEAGRTSVLSIKWRKKWYTKPNLVFNRQCVTVVDSYYRRIDPSVIQTNFSRIIDHILLLHSGAINKFEVSDPGFDLLGVNSRVDIDRWILQVTRRSIKDFVLDIWLDQHYKIPWCLFSCQTIQHLNLSFCCLEPPTTFKGFKNLISLDLNQVTITQDAFENLISGSPLLEKLTLTEVDGLTQINIYAPNLKFFHAVGQFEDISFETVSS